MLPVSVVIPLYNKARVIHRALTSVLSQSVACAAIIVVDDGSTDGGGDKAGETGSPLVRVVRQANGGVSAARNRGIREAETELVAFLDADDEWKPDFLETAIDLYERFPEAGMWCTAYEAVAEDGFSVVPLEFLAVPRSPEGGLIEDYFRCMLKYSPACCSSVLGRKTVFEEVGGFPEGEKIGEDLDTWARIALRYPIAFSPKTRAIYRMDAPGRASCTERFSGAQTCLARTLTSALEQGGHSMEIEKSIRLLLGKHLLRVAKQCLAAGNVEDTLKHLNEASRLRGWPWRRWKLRLRLWRFRSRRN
ncbi:MAG: glycosyltransferase family 2 protein [Lentisphaerales bacterium]|nr:MAG: glycosyltransferase family 2 protein [Lentisphaerales bacterium]